MVDHPEFVGRHADLFRNDERTLDDFALRRLRAAGDLVSRSFDSLCAVIHPEWTRSDPAG